ncbi:MAG TPA: phosphoribosylformylglycinamidine synthase I [Candidatus Omnitrophica bacterium]|nr:phosphoribosylformylglycinamidine synthase I [Candidatus Omnitrophota bacterium]HCI44610.1 phosphoribosylformylglycinamidine synthase I [Candidatus Omnitrophota bacterium]
MGRGQVKVIVLRTAGTNCDAEAAFAFENCGAQVRAVHINQFFDGRSRLHDGHILVIPGGFTYGDDIGSGRILANELRLRLGEDLGRFIGDGKLMLGICNGFQVMVKAGILPGPLDAQPGKGHDSFFPREEPAGAQTATLTDNDSGKFEDRWCHLKTEGKSVWTGGLGDVVYFPVAHAEGKFIPHSRDVLAKLRDNGQVAFRYCNPQGGKPSYPENPNGSVDDIAGITDKTGRILGLMPHPERHFLFTQHPCWTRLSLPAGKAGPNGKHGHGAKIFANGVQYVQKHLL